MPRVKESNNSNLKTSQKINHKLYNVSHLMPWQEKSMDQYGPSNRTGYSGLKLYN